MIRSRLKSANVNFSSQQADVDHNVIDAEYTDISEQQSPSGPTKH